MGWSSHAAYINLHLNLPFGNDLLQSTWRVLLKGDEALKKLLGHLQSWDIHTVQVLHYSQSKEFLFDI